MYHCDSPRCCGSNMQSRCCGRQDACCPRCGKPMMARVSMRREMPCTAGANNTARSEEACAGPISRCAMSACTASVATNTDCGCLSSPAGAMLRVPCDLPLATSYVRPQEYTKAYCPQEALCNGTLFPELNWPYK